MAASFLIHSWSPYADFSASAGDQPFAAGTLLTCNPSNQLRTHLRGHREGELIRGRIVLCLVQDILFAKYKSFTLK
jgi:hypothetical protein